MSPDMPRSIVHVSTALTQSTGVTMRELRFRRFVWARYGWMLTMGGDWVGAARHLAETERAMKAELPIEAALHQALDWRRRHEATSS